LFSNGGRRLASAGRIFDTASGLPAVPPLRVDADEFHMALSEDGRRIATAGHRLVRVWDTATGEPLSPVLALRGNLTINQALVFSPDGRRLLTLSNSGGTGEAIVWDVAAGTPVITLTHGGFIHAGGFSADGSRLMTATDERDVNVRIWNVDGGTLALSGRHPEGVRLAIVDRVDDRILTVGFDQRVLAWQAGSTLTSSEVLELHSEPTALAIGGQRTIVAGGRGGDVRVRRLGSAAESTTSMYQSGAVLAADISPDGEWLVTSGDDGRANLWNVRSGERLSPPHRVGGPMEAVRFSPDGRSFGMSGSGVHLQALVPDTRPTALLTDVAELISARRLVNASDSPLRLDDLVARWNRLSPGAPPDIGTASPSWYRRQASLALFRANPALALEHQAALGGLGPLSWTDTMISLAALARAGRWGDAVQEIQRLSAARDAVPEMVFVEAVARRRAGDVQAPRTACDDLLARHGTTQNPDRALWIVRICLLDPDAASAAAGTAMAGLVGQMLDLASYGTRDSFAGALAVRAARLPEAIDVLTRAAAGGEATPHTALFLAMALARSQRAAEARKWLLASEQFAWPPANLYSRMAFREAWFDAEAVILREEVTRLLDGPGR
jgi:hypothetical protein